jgi:hypothetical protein
MKVSELKAILEHSMEDEEVVVILSEPSMGPVAMVSVASASYGLDWEKGKLLLRPNAKLVRLKDKEALWQSAHDFIYTLSNEKTYKGNPTHLAKCAQSILDRAKSKVEKP